MISPTTVRFDRLQRALQSVLTDALDTAGGGPEVGWSYGSAVYEATPASGALVSLSLSGGPAPRLRTHRRDRTQCHTTSADVRVDAPVLAGRATLTLNEHRYATDTTAGEPAVDVRDRLVVQVALDALETAAATPVGADILRLAETEVGGLWSLDLGGGLSLDSKVDTGEALAVSTTANAVLLTIAVFSRATEPRNGAWSIVGQIQAALASRDYLDVLDAVGVGVWTITPPTDLSEIAGGAWESRVSFDLTLALRSTWVRPVAQIDDLTQTLQITA